MQKKDRSRGKVFTFFIILAFLANVLPLKAQDVITSDDISGGFVFRASSGSTQKKTAYRNASLVKRSNSQKIATTKRIRKQSVTVAKINPKRTKSKQVTPDVAADPTISRKPKEEVSLIFAGAGEYYLEKGEIDKAVNIFRESILLNEKNTNGKYGLSDAVTRKGDSLLEQEKPEIAQPFYREAIQNNEKNAAAYAGLGEAYDLLDENDKALENYLKALSLDSELTELYTPIGSLYFQKGDMLQADSYLTKALAVSADNAETQLFLGLVRYKQDRTDEATAAFRRAIELDPASAEAHYYLGETLDKAGKTTEAIAEYNTAIQINPKYTEAWFDLGVAYYNTKKYEEAINAYKQTIKLKNTMGEAHANLADVYRQLNRFNEAIAEYRLAVAFIKYDAEIYSKFGYVAGKIATDPSKSNFWDLAIENLTKALALSSDFVDYSNLGWAFYNSAQVDLIKNNKAEANVKLQKAKTNLLEAIKLNQKMPASYLNLGITQTDLGEYKDAIESLKRADEMRKDWIPVINYLGVAYAESGDFASAVKQFRRAVEIDGKYALGYFNIGRTALRQKDIKEAKKAYEKLVEINTNQSKYFAAQLVIASNGAVRR
jgi:superkiller protein 3